MPTIDFFETPHPHKGDPHVQKHRRDILERFAGKKSLFLERTASFYENSRNTNVVAFSDNDDAVVNKTKATATTAADASAKENAVRVRFDKKTMGKTTTTTSTMKTRSVLATK